MHPHATVPDVSVKHSDSSPTTSVGITACGMCPERSRTTRLYCERRGAQAKGHRGSMIGIHLFQRPNRAELVLQLLATLGVLAFLPGSLQKLGAFVLIWAVTFRSPTRGEAAMFTVACVFFTAMNAATLEQGIFRFTHAEFLGMPYYETLMWGFYLLHTRRMIGGVVPTSTNVFVWVLAAAYAVTFAAIGEPRTLLAVTATLLALAFWRHHDPGDLAYVGYMILLGALVEHTGVWAGEWSYPALEAGGVPTWFITLWGGVGFFLRRLVLPYVARFERAPSTRA